MPGSTVGLIHPGQMGVTVGAAARSAGARVVWASRGRSAQSVLDLPPQALAHRELQPPVEEPEAVSGQHQCVGPDVEDADDVGM